MPPSSSVVRCRRAASRSFGRIDVTDRVCLDLGASTGGFTRALLHAGARRVFAVDVGFGQLLGGLRVDPRVIVLERTNLSEVQARLERGTTFDVVTMDLSYLSIARALPQLEELPFARHADLVALVKPQYELGLDAPPSAEVSLAAALGGAIEAVAASGWELLDATRSPVRGRNGAIEWLVHARRAGDLRPA
jgi:23S rRNA (cytidine1920-2'-O)/16S rRNA (cytidine1409-2'-O)-methyltransferase